MGEMETGRPITDSSGVWKREIDYKRKTRRAVRKERETK
jgi:hypothetical protein